MNTSEDRVRAIGQGLRARRKDLRMSITEACRRAGISRSMLSRLENGRIANPTLTTLFRCGEMLKLNIKIELTNQEQDT